MVRSYELGYRWDWLNDFFEIDDDLLDGIRGNSGSPIRYDDRTLTPHFICYCLLTISWKKGGSFLLRTRR